MINTFSLYAEPSSCTDFKSTPFIPFLPSLPRRLRKHRRMHRKHKPSTTIEMPMKTATTPHLGMFSTSSALSKALSGSDFAVVVGIPLPDRGMVGSAVLPAERDHSFPSVADWIFLRVRARLLVAGAGVVVVLDVSVELPSGLTGACRFFMRRLIAIVNHWKGIGHVNTSETLDFALWTIISANAINDAAERKVKKIIYSLSQCTVGH